MLCLAIIISKAVVIHVSEDRVKTMIEYLNTLGSIFKEEKLSRFTILHRDDKLQEEEEVKEFEIFNGGVVFIKATNKSSPEKIEEIKKELPSDNESTKLTVVLLVTNE